MRKLKLYIETSVWSHYYADDAPEKRELTRLFFEQCRRNPNVEMCISVFVLRELRDAPSPLSETLTDLVEEFEPEVLQPTDIASILAEAFATHGALPPRRTADRAHAAMATIYQMDLLVSWNYRDLVNVRRRDKVGAVSRLMGFTVIPEIVTPPEVFGDEVQPETD